jgi:hypothetical protein
MDVLRIAISLEMVATISSILLFMFGMAGMQIKLVWNHFPTAQ